MKLVFLDAKTLGDDISLEKFKDFGDVKVYLSTTKEQTLQRVKDTDIVITNKVVIDSSIMRETNIKLICVAATGMNNIDLEFAKGQGIDVKNVAGYSTSSVVQLTFALALSLINNISYFDNYSKSQDGWLKSDVFTHFTPTFFDIKDKTWGIIGLGSIGSEVAKVASAFGANVIYYSTSGKNKNELYKRVELEELLKTSNIISIHAPLNKETKNLINSTNLPLLNDIVVLLNLGRGGIINESDLASFMDKSAIKVGLDVLEDEPIKKDNPLLNIKNKQNLIMTPHLAWASVESRERLIEGIYKNIKEFS